MNNCTNQSQDISYDLNDLDFLKLLAANVIAFSTVIVFFGWIKAKRGDQPIALRIEKDQQKQLYTSMKIEY